MSKRSKKTPDAAFQNKEQFIQDNYLKKEDESQNNTSQNKKRAVIVFMLFVLLACLGFVFFWSYSNESAFNQPSEQLLVSFSAEPTVTPAGTLSPATASPVTILEKYNEYLDIYPDMVGWISIDNIKVDYPVVQSPDPLDPFKYLDKGPDEEKSKYGAIFLDIRNSANATDRNIIIYGHNMKDGSMFGQLDMYLKKTFFEEHMIIRYDTLYQELEWEVFNVFKTTTDFYYIETYFTSDDDFVNLMAQCVYKSYFNNNETVISADDTILTLSTCTDGNNEEERLVVQARLITPLIEIEIPSAAYISSPNQ